MNKNSKNHQENFEFSRIVTLKDIMSSAAPLNMAIIAEQGELDALAKRFDLLGISSLSANVRLTPIATLVKGVKDSETMPDILLEADFKANLTQTCSVSLEPVEDEIKAYISQIFSPRWQAVDDGESADFEEDGEFIEFADVDDENDITPEPPEPIINGKIDIGEFIAEELAVRINPFPRKKGVEFEWVSDDSDSSGAGSGPFAALAALKDGLENGKKPKK